MADKQRPHQNIVEVYCGLQLLKNKKVKRDIPISPFAFGWWKKLLLFLFLLVLHFSFLVSMRSSRHDF